MMNKRLLILGSILFVAVRTAAGDDAMKPTVFEGETIKAREVEVFRDDRASGKRCAGVILNEGAAPIVSLTEDRPAGDYEAVFWLEAAPIEILHHLAVTIRAGENGLTLGQIQFDARQGYQPFPLRFFHPGGKLTLACQASGGTGFDGMRKDISEQERASLPTTPTEAGLMELTPTRAQSEEADDLVLDDLEGERSVKRLTAYEHRVFCDRIELRALRLAPAAVVRVEVDKVHYLPNETVKARVWVQVPAGSGALRFVAEDVTELDSAREVFARDLGEAATPAPLEFEFKLDGREFGHELRGSLRSQDRVVHARGEFFGVSSNVYRVGVTCDAGPQDMRTFSAEDGARLMQAAKKAYANYFERFAWAPCDYSNLAPADEIFYSGQVQYQGSRKGYSNLLNEAHRVGVKGITYGKPCGAGIEGFRTFQRRPELFGHSAEGTASEAMSVFYLERMVANDYNLHAPPSEGGWQHWASLWTDWTKKETVEFGAEAIIKSVEMFGWDGVRWDGHFTGNQKPFIDILNARFPNFVHGYNIAFANPGSALFLPPDTNDFHVVAAQHGMMMDESVRDWSHSNFSPGYPLPFYEAICREADYEKRIGGLPLYITFDMASGQDRTFCVLSGLAAGQRYTYLTSPGDFTFGPLPKFLARYSAFVWDDTRRVAHPETHIAVTAADPQGAAPWWRESAWLRSLPDGRQQLLVNLLNPIGYSNFCARVQPPPRRMSNVTVRVATPAGATLVRAAHVSPDLPEGHRILVPKIDGKDATLILPEVRTWSILVLEYAGGSQPAFALTTPLEDAAAVLNKQAEEQVRKVEEQKAKAGIGPQSVKAEPTVPFYRDYATERNADLETEKALVKPASLALLRDGALDIHHARGAFSWLNPVEAAAGILGAARCDPSWVDLVGFKLGAKGCMDEFPDTYEQLLAYDVLVIDNINARYLGAERRAMIADFVRQGGGLLVMGGYYNFSLGADHNTYLADLSPVKIARYDDVLRDAKGLALKAEKPAFFEKVDWSKPLYAFMVDTSPVRDGSEVLLTAGGKPAIVGRRYGQGRVLAVLINPHGIVAPDLKPYWESTQWPRILASCVSWLGQGSEVVANRAALKREIDPKKITPKDLFLETADLDPKQFTAMLKEARVNMIDADSARIMLETAVDRADKIEDLDLLAEIVEQASPYLDKSMAPLGEKLARSDFAFLRQAGYRIIGLAGDAQYRTLLEAGLIDRETFAVREALIGLGRLGDPASEPAVKRYLEKQGTERLLAFSVLVRLGRRDQIPDALAAYEKGLRRRVQLKCGRGAIIDTLWGGVSFKLTPAARRSAMMDYRNILKLEAATKQDLQYFMASIEKPDAKDREALGRFLAATQMREVLPMAYTVLNRLPATEAAALKAQLASAALPELRLAAE
jgi:uncharacterized membrane protein